MTRSVPFSARPGRPATAARAATRRGAGLAALAVGVVLLPAMQAQAFLARNSASVEGDRSAFRVDYSAGLRIDDYWCAAAEYAIGPLRLPPATRIWRTTPSGPKAEGGMGFSVDAAQSSGDTGIVTFGRSDGSLTVSHAGLMCEPRNKKSD